MSEGPLSIDARSCALIIQDLQNDVITEGGAFAESGAPAHAKSQNIVGNVKRLADAARSAGIPVIHVHYIVEPGARGLKQNAPLFIDVKDSNALVRGSWGAVWTNMSIEHTARHGADAGYVVLVVSDGTSTTGEEWQNAALNYAMTNVGRVVATDEVVQALRAGAAV